MSFFQYFWTGQIDEINLIKKKIHMIRQKKTIDG